MRSIHSGQLALLAGALVAGCRSDTTEPTPPLGAGSVIWHVPSTPGWLSHTPVGNADASMIYFRTPDRHLRKIRAADGHVMWDRDLGPTAFFTPPGWNLELAGDVVVMGEVDLYAFDTTTGAPRWFYGDPVEEIAYSRIDASADAIYSVSREARLHAIGAHTGQRLWVTDLTGGDPKVGALNATYHDGVVYTCTRSVGYIPEHGTFWAIDAATGAIRWSVEATAEYPQQDAVCYGNATVWHDRVIQPMQDGRVQAFDVATGALLWTAPRVHRIPPEGGMSAWLDDRTAVATEHGIIVLSATTSLVTSLDPLTGREQWRIDPEIGAFLQWPVADESTAYVWYGAASAGFDLATGREVWRDPARQSRHDSKFEGVPVIAPDRLFFTASDGAYAIKR